MQIQDNVSLRDHSTMRLGGPAAHLATVTSREELQEAVAWADSLNVPIIMIGQGSNIVWGDRGFAGLVLVNAIQRFEMLPVDEKTAYLTVGGGEIWDSVVQRAVQAGYSGIENLSLIPGTAGAAPVQNIGAYGKELSEVLTSVEAYDTKTKQLVTIPRMDCGFGYRTSRFKTTDRGRYFITAITLNLTKETARPPFYASLQSYLEEHSITDYSAANLRSAVMAIRSSKLPDPAKVANCGSFFTNPLVNEDKVQTIISDYPGLMYWRQDNGAIKISAAWLIEQAGFKTLHDETTGMGLWDKQPLVFVNEHAQTTAQLLSFKQKIVEAVKAKFGVELIQEPELLGDQ